MWVGTPMRVGTTLLPHVPTHPTTSSAALRVVLIALLLLPRSPHTARRPAQARAARPRCRPVELRRSWMRPLRHPVGYRMPHPAPALAAPCADPRNAYTALPASALRQLLPGHRTKVRPFCVFSVVPFPLCFPSYVALQLPFVASAPPESSPAARSQAHRSGPAPPADPRTPRAKCSAAGAPPA